VNSDPTKKLNAEIDSGIPQVGEGGVLDGPVKDAEKPLPLRDLLTRPVVLSIANYAMIGLIDMGAITLIPLVWSTSVELGGLSMSPASIGLWMAGCGLSNSIFQFVALPRLVGRFGPRSVFITSIFCFFPVYVMFPLENLAARHSSRGTNLATVLLITLQLLAYSLSDMGFGKFPRTKHCAAAEVVRKGTICMYIASAAPNKRSLGATNGVAQTVVSIQRAVGPAAAASLFAFSLENNILGGNFAYIVLLATVWAGLGVAVQLPKTTWRYNEE
jgi:hypothetical protein